MSTYKKGLFIYNPMSGSREVATKLDEIVNKFMKHDIILTIIRLEDKVYDRLGQIFKDFEYDFIIGSGGDGTINAIARSMINNNIDKPYAVIGCGTCNNFASNINMPQDLNETLDQILLYNTEKVDVGTLGDNKTFLSSFAVGIFAATSFETNSDLKEWLGPLAYYLHGITKLTNIKANKFKIKTDDKYIEEMAYMVLVLNGNHVGGVKNVLNNKVNIQDGIFELIIIKETPNPIEIANLLMKVVKGEDFTTSNFIRVERGKMFEIDCEDTSLGVSVDGEEGPKLPVKIGILEKKLNVIVGENGIPNNN